MVDRSNSERLRGFDFRQTERRTDRHFNICDCRVVFATENIRWVWNWPVSKVSLLFSFQEYSINQQSCGLRINSFEEQDEGKWTCYVSFEGSEKKFKRNLWLGLYSPRASPTSSTTFTTTSFTSTSSFTSTTSFSYIFLTSTTTTPTTTTPTTTMMMMGNGPD